MVEMDEAYTRRVLGFESVEEMYRWISCEELLNQIDDLPTLLVNSLDDPCIVDESHVIPKTFAGVYIHVCTCVYVKGWSRRKGRGLLNYLLYSPGRKVPILKVMLHQVMHACVCMCVHTCVYVCKG